MTKTEALEKIKELCKPSQELYHSQCIDIMCDIYNLAKKVLESKEVAAS